MSRLILALTLASMALAAGAPGAPLHPCCKTQAPCCGETCCKVTDNCCKGQLKNPCAHDCAENPQGRPAKP
jgi:hypothetical protein